MPKGKYFGASEMELEKLVAEMVAWREQEFAARRAYYLQHGKYPRSPRRTYLPTYTVVRIKAEVHATYHKNHRVLYRQAYRDPAAVTNSSPERVDPFSLEGLQATIRELELSYAPEVCTGVIVGVRRRQEGRRFPGSKGGWESEPEPATFEQYRSRSVYLVAVNLFSNPIQVLVEDVEVVPADPKKVSGAVQLLQSLMDGK